MGKGIKTRSVADKTIKAIDKAAVASERMKEAYIRTKDKGEHGLYAEEGSPGEYASDRISPGLKTRPVKLSTNLTSRAAKGLRPPKRTFPRSKKKSRSTRPQPNSLKNKRRSRRQDRPDRPQTVFRSR